MQKKKGCHFSYVRGQYIGCFEYMHDVGMRSSGDYEEEYGVVGKRYVPERGRALERKGGRVAAAGHDKESDDGHQSVQSSGRDC